MCRVTLMLVDRCPNKQKGIRQPRKMPGSCYFAYPNISLRVVFRFRPGIGEKRKVSGSPSKENSYEQSRKGAETIAASNKEQEKSHSKFKALRASLKL